MAGTRGSALPALLVLDGLACERDGRSLFRALSIVLNPGECLELAGPNGSGKSTLLRVIAGLYPDFTGTVRAAECLYVGHRPGISVLLTAAENLRWYAALQAGDGSTAWAVARALERVGMAGYDNVPCQQLSAGQLRRVALARLHLGGGPLWLLDEPLTALDTAGQRLVAELIEQHLAAGGGVVCATHQSPGAGNARRLVLGDAVAADAGALP